MTELGRTANPLWPTGPVRRCAIFAMMALPAASHPSPTVVTMLFNSLTFVVFFALVVGGYWTLRSWEARKNLLLVASYVFYGTWNPPFALLLFATTAVDFYLGARIARAATPVTRRGWLVASLISNLSMLGFFKYGN